jgi:hypothetical protein
VSLCVWQELIGPEGCSYDQRYPVRRRARRVHLYWQDRASEGQGDPLLQSFEGNGNGSQTHRSGEQMITRSLTKSTDVSPL